MRSVALVGTVTVFVGGCSGDRPTLGDAVAPTTTTTVADEVASPGAERLTSEYEDAVAALIDAGSYRFEAEVSIASGGDRTELQLMGWVDGPDRELTLRSASGEVTTRVTNGVATVERDGQTTAVALESAPEEPSLDVLNQVTDISYAPGGLLQGSLSARALADIGFDVNGAARLDALVHQGVLARYTITANNEAWTITSEFTDVGQVNR